MSNPVSERSIPFRWPSAWTGPEMLDLLKSSPIDCLLDAPSDVAEAARARGLTAVTHDQASSSVHFLPDPQWPGIRAARKQDSGDAGPTGSPWVDANVWAIRLAKSLNPGKPVWVEAVPEKNTVQNDRSCLLAVAESAACGARWVVSLDEPFAKGLASKEPSMVARWNAVADAIRFFESHRPAAALESRANLVVVSDFAGANEFLSREFLNMADRRNLAWRVVAKNIAGHGISGAPSSILYVDEQAPEAGVAAKLKEVTRAGGLLIASKQSGIASWGEATASCVIPGYTCKSLGKGKIAVPDKPWDDPFVLAAEVRILVGRRSDVLRLFNTGTMAASYVRSKDGNTGVVHLLKYTRRPSVDQVSIAPADEYTRAQVVSLEHPAGELVKIAARPQRFNEIPVSSFAIYSAIELRRG